MALSTDGASSGAPYALAVASGATGDTTVKPKPGRLGSVLLTSANGAAAISIFDNASGHTGTIIGYIAASAAAGTVAVFNMPAANGITIQGAATNGGMTVSYW